MHGLKDSDTAGEKRFKRLSQILCLRCGAWKLVYNFCISVNLQTYRFELLACIFSLFGMKTS